MRNLLSLTVFVIVCQITTQAQEEKTVVPKISYRLDRQNPLFILDGKELSDSTSLASLNLNDIQSMEILNEEQAVKTYGNKGIKGVVIITSKIRSGEPIRFINSDHISNSSLLFILDDIEIKERSLASINPDDIDQITILKEKQAIEPYGDKGKNGVVLITSKAKKHESLVIRNSYPTKKQEPLYILNDFEMKDGLKSINPNDIEQVLVLKAKDAEPYGDNGKNGVVLITTKKYQQSKSTLDR